MTREALIDSLTRLGARALALAADVEAGAAVRTLDVEDLPTMARAVVARARMLEARRPGWECDDDCGRAWLLHLPGGAAARVQRYAVATTGDGWWLWMAATAHETSGTMRGLASLAAAQTAAEAWLRARGESLPGDEAQASNRDDAAGGAR